VGEASMKKFKDKMEAGFSMAEWLFIKGLLLFCLADEGHRFVVWMIHQ
jgi:hypothetical protein